MATVGKLIARNLDEYRKQRNTAMIRSCSVTQKIPYVSRGDAGRAARVIRANGGDRAYPYRCECGQFHLARHR